MKYFLKVGAPEEQHPRLIASLHMRLNTCAPHKQKHTEKQGFNGKFERLAYECY